VVSLRAEEFNFDKLQSGGLPKKLAVAAWNLGTISAFTNSPVGSPPIANAAGS
jgi:hypothetical protein